MLEHDRVHAFLYTEYVGWARCMAEVGCVEKQTSTEELIALLMFYDSFSGSQWRINDNWLDGDPCLNQWYGIGCNTEGNIITIHFFENHLVGVDFPDEFVDLIHLKHLSIFNGDTMYEGVANTNANKIDHMPLAWGTHTELEEINFSWVEM